MKRFLIVYLIVLSSTMLAQSNLHYYGYYDCTKAMYDQKNNIDSMQYMNMNSGVAPYNKFKFIVDNSNSGKKFIVNITDYFRTEAVDGTTRPKIDNLNSSTSLSDLVEALCIDSSDSKYRDAVLGFLVEEPFAHVEHQVDFATTGINYNNLKFVVKGKFCGNGNLDDIALISANEGGTKIEMMKSDGTTWLVQSLAWYNNLAYSIDNVKYAVAGDFNNDGHEDLALVYEYPDKFQIHVFSPNDSGTAFRGNGYSSVFSINKTDYTFSNLKFVTAGNYTGEGKDEFALFYRTNDSSYIQIVKSDSSNNVLCWYKRPNSGAYNRWDINYIKAVSSGNYDGLKNSSGVHTDEIAALYDYPASDSSRIEVFKGNNNGTDNSSDRFLELEVWFAGSYNDINFNLLKTGFHSADFNYDGKDDIVILIDSVYDKAIKFKSDPSNNRFQNTWMSRRGYICANKSAEEQYSHLKFSVAGNFYENNSTEDRFNDSYWEGINYVDGIDDVMLFYDTKLVCEFTKPHLSFASKERLQMINDRIKNVFGTNSRIPNVKTMILYMEVSTFIPEVFDTTYDWIGTDPYPFTKDASRAATFSEGETIINTAVSNVINGTPSNKKVFLVGLAAQGVNSTYIERFPDSTETNYYYEAAKSDPRITGLFWWTYEHISGQWWGIKDTTIMPSDLRDRARKLRAQHREISSLIESYLLKRNNIEDHNTPIEYSFKLFQNYPNPFNPITTIKYMVPQNGYVSLKVYDILGREVSELVNGYQSSGTYSVDFNGSNLSSGIYFYKLNASSFNSVNKMIILK